MAGLRATAAVSKSETWHQTQFQSYKRLAVAAWLDGENDEVRAKGQSLYCCSGVRVMRLRVWSVISGVPGMILQWLYRLAAGIARVKPED